MNQINVEETLKDIKKEYEEHEMQVIQRSANRWVEAQKMSLDVLPIQDVPMDLQKKLPVSEESPSEFDMVYKYLNKNYILPSYYSMGSGFRSFFKKAVQRLARCVVAPLSGRQSEYNANVIHGMNLLRDQIIELQRQNEELTFKYSLLEAKEKATQMMLDSYMMNLSHALTNLPLTGDNLSEAPRKENISTQDDAESKDYYEDLDYFKFQNKFRGSSDVILDHMRIYKPYFENAKGTVLDFGCGRGEFLQLMKELGVPAVGIDSYSEYVALGKLKGVDIRQGDAVEYLRNTEESFGGIFVGQVVEHIGFPNIVKLCKLAYEKLQPGGYLVMETPNAACLAIYTNSFYLDPTHQTPVHPLLLQYVAQEVGFSNVDILYTEGSRCPESIPSIQSDAITNLEEVNTALHQVSEKLFGSMDYAIIARK